MALHTVEDELVIAALENQDRIHILVAPDLDITMGSQDQMIGLKGAQDTRLLGQTTMRPHVDDELLPPELEAPALTAWRGAIRCVSNILGKEPC